MASATGGLKWCVATLTLIAIAAKCGDEDGCFGGGDDDCPPYKTISGRTVSVGTIGYRHLDTPNRPQHGINGSHHNIFKANQYPPPKCDCFWQPLGAVSPAVLPADAIPIELFAN